MTAGRERPAHTLGHSGQNSADRVRARGHCRPTRSANGRQACPRDPSPARARTDHDAALLLRAAPTVNDFVRAELWGVSPQENANACVPNEPQQGRDVLPKAGGAPERRNPIRNCRWHGPPPSLPPGFSASSSASLKQCSGCSDAGAISRCEARKKCRGGVPTPARGRK